MPVRVISYVVYISSRPSPRTQFTSHAKQARILSLVPFLSSSITHRNISLTPFLQTPEKMKSTLVTILLMALAPNLSCGMFQEEGDRIAIEVMFLTDELPNPYTNQLPHNRSFPAMPLLINNDHLLTKSLPIKSLERAPDHKGWLQLSENGDKLESVDADGVVIDAIDLTIKQRDEIQSKHEAALERLSGQETVAEKQDKGVAKIQAVCADWASICDVQPDCFFYNCDDCFKIRSVGVCFGYS